MATRLKLKVDKYAPDISDKTQVEWIDEKGVLRESKILGHYPNDCKIKVLVDGEERILYYHPQASWKPQVFAPKRIRFS